MSIIGYAMLTTFDERSRLASWAYGAIRNVQERSPSPVATISESTRLAQSRPGFRRRTRTSSPTTRTGYMPR